MKKGTTAGVEGGKASRVFAQEGVLTEEAKQLCSYMDIDPQSLQIR
jgi:hypothetical protein